MNTLTKFWENTKRVFIVAKKPTTSEYLDLAKVTGLGILLLGVIGFILLLFLRIFYMPG